MTTCVRAYEYCERSKRIARTSRASRRNSAASCSPSPGSSQSPSATISSGWRRPFDAPNGKPRRSMTARPSSRPGCAFSAAHRSLRRCGWNRRSRKTSMSGPASAQERDCYVCKQPFAKVHRYYDSMCEPCGDFNYAKREQSADLSGQYALITGARVKIGYQASLKLLRAGAHVIVTTRFPVDAADRYSQRAGFLLVSGAAADPRAGSAPHAERGTVHEISRRAAAAPRLHSQQRVPDGASAGGILSTPAGAGS